MADNNNLRIGQEQFSDIHKAVLTAIFKIASGQAQDVIIRVPDEESANRMNDIIREAVDKIRIEFDSTEKGPNPLWTPSKLTADKGKVILQGPYGQTSHQDKSIIVGQ